MVFKAQSMSVLDVYLEGRHYMVMMPLKQKSHHQGLAIAGQSGAFAVAAVVTESTRRRLPNLKPRRRKDYYFSRKKKINPLHMLLVRLMKVLQVTMNFKETLELFLELHLHCNCIYNLTLLPLGAENEKAGIVNQQKLEKKFGQSSVFVTSTLLENGGTLKSASPASLLKEAIHVISCGYEDKTDWGKEVKSRALWLVVIG
jgi:hypothetical protein